MLFYLITRNSILALPKHRSLRELRVRSRTWIARQTVTVAGFAASVGQLFHPASLGMIGSFLVCFAIVLSPPHYSSQSSTAAHALLARQNDFEVSSADSLKITTGQTTKLKASRETSDRFSEQADVAAVVASETPQGWVDKARAETARRNLSNHDHVREVQQKLSQLGYLSVPSTGLWGPLSRKALRAFKTDHGLMADEIWDETTERSLFSDGIEQAAPFVGIWGVETSACSSRLNTKGYLPAVIDGDGAWAGETFCTFQKKQRTTEGWNLVAKCTNGHDRWIANVHLIINGDQLTWISERGSQSYLRCRPGLSIARAF